MTALGMIACPLASLADMLAGSSAFQAWTGTDAATAQYRAHIVTIPRSATAPLALVDFGDWARDRLHIQPGRVFEQRATSAVLLYFRAPVPDGPPLGLDLSRYADDDKRAVLEFCHHVSLVLADLEAVAATMSPDRLAFRSIEMVAAPTRIVAEKRDARGDYFETAFSLGYTRSPVVTV
jgi:hypothetical protein